MLPAKPLHRPQFSHTTTFFRNRPQLEELAGELIPHLWPSPDQELQLLVCGGSIGCEAYSFLISLQELSRQPHRANALSIDIAEDVTEQARSGYFGAETFRPLFGMEGGLPDEIRSRWFTADASGTHWRPVPALLLAAEFQTLDLLNQPLARDFEIVICQNVLTHLQTPAAETLLGRLLDRAKQRSVFVCSGVDLDLKARIASAGFKAWTGNLDRIHEAFVSHRMHYRLNRGQHYFELEDIDRTRPDWEVRYSTLFYRE